MHLLNCLNNITAYSEAETQLQSKGLIIKKYPDLDLYLVKYNKESCDMDDPDVQKCRGLVLSILDNKLVCIPPFKSIGVNDFSNIIPNLSETNYEEFIDGTMINIFYWNNDWIISTRSMIGAGGKWFSNKTFNELFTDSSINLEYDKLDKDTCYTVVLQHPDNRIVTSYDKPQFTLVCVRKVDNDNYTDLDLKDVQTNLYEKGIEINIPKKYKFSDFMKAMEYVNNQNYEFQGLVMKYNNFRSKIRNTKYNYVKNLKGNTRNIKYTYLNLRQNNTLKSFLDFFPEYELL